MDDYLPHGNPIHIRIYAPPIAQAGWQVTVIDNLANSNEGSLERVGAITGKPEAVTFKRVDLRDKAELDAVFAAESFDAVIHFAGYKAVGESRQKPMLYYSNNVAAAVNLLEVMAARGVKTLVFSSSCTVYGGSPSPLTEESEIGTQMRPSDRSLCLVAPGLLTLAILQALASPTLTHGASSSSRR